MILTELSEIVSAAFAKRGYDASLGSVVVSARPDLCQFQCNGSFEGAKKYKKAPAVIAAEAAALLEKNPVFKSVEVVPPGFLNLNAADEYIIKNVNEIYNDKYCGIPQHNETIVLDYGGPNVAKPLHIGHLRSAIIGESLKRIARATGRTVISDVHLGDWGLQIGLVIAEYESLYPGWRCFAPDFDAEKDITEAIDINDLNEIYPYASKKSKENESFKNRAKEITAALQNGHKGYMALWKEILRVSVNDLKANYRRLNVDFDCWYGESDAEKYVPELIRTLEEKGIIYESEGAMIVDVSRGDDKAPVPPVIIKKSDNSNMYSTTDLATIMQRQRDFNPDAVWYVVDKRQELHFTQVFRCAEKAELTGAELLHLGFGTMNGSDGKPYKTRDGGVMRLSDFVETIIDAAGKKLNESEFTAVADKREIAEKIAAGAIKFGDLSNHRLKDYIFDIEKFLSFEGKTGTYLIYTVSRINSILKKLGINEDAVCIKFDRIYSNVEREIFLNIALTYEAFQKAVKEKAPNIICENAYNLAALFSSFYHGNHIGSEPDKEKRAAWLSVCIIVRKMLLKQLDVLGIEPVDGM